MLYVLTVSFSAMHGGWGVGGVGGRLGWQLPLLSLSSVTECPAQIEKSNLEVFMRQKCSGKFQPWSYFEQFLKIYLLQTYSFNVFTEFAGPLIVVFVFFPPLK